MVNRLKVVHCRQSLNQGGTRGDKVSCLKKIFTRICIYEYYSNYVLISIVFSLFHSPSYFSSDQSDRALGICIPLLAILLWLSHKIDSQGRGGQKDLWYWGPAFLQIITSIVYIFKKKFNIYCYLRGARI